MNFALSPQHLGALGQMAWAWMVAFLPRLAAAAILLVLGLAIARWAGRLASRLSARAPHLDATVRPLIGTVTRYAVLILVYILALGELGVQTASLLAVIGAAGLAVGLALQGTLSNIASGIMLLWLRPFQLGDFIEVGAVSGTIRRIDLFASQLESADGMFLFVPNSALWNAPLRNHSRGAARLVGLNVTLPAGADLAKAREALLGLAGEDPEVLAHPAPRLFVESLGAGALVVNLGLWTRPGAVGQVQRRLIEGAKRRLDAGGEALAPQQILRVFPPDADPSRFLPAPPGAPE